MLRFFGAGVLLLTIASSVTAGERYVEIWNPPEAGVGASIGKCPSKSHASASTSVSVSRHSAARVVPRRIADPLPRSSLSKRTPVAAVKKPVAPPSGYIPRLITPEGNVLRV
jgi:hypothetical protein